LTRGFNKLFNKQLLKVEQATVTTKEVVRLLSTREAWEYAPLIRNILNLEAGKCNFQQA